MAFFQGGSNSLTKVNKKFNKDVLWILPITSSNKSDRFHYLIDTPRTSSIVLSQIRLISSKRLLRRVGTVEENDFVEIAKAIQKFLPIY